MIFSCCSSVNRSIMSSRSKLHFGSLVGPRFSSKVAFLLEAKNARGNIVGEPPYRRIILLGRFVECAALGADAVFGTLQLRLQFEEVLVGLQFRVTLNTHQQAPQ